MTDNNRPWDLVAVLMLASAVTFCLVSIAVSL